MHGRGEKLGGDEAQIRERQMQNSENPAVVLCRHWLHGGVSGSIKGVGVFPHQSSANQSQPWAYASFSHVGNTKQNLLFGDICSQELLIDITPRNCFVVSNDLAAVYSSPLRVQLQEVERSCLKHGPAEEEP